MIYWWWNGLTNYNWNLLYVFVSISVNVFSDCFNICVFSVQFDIWLAWYYCLSMWGKFVIRSISWQKLSLDFVKTKTLNLMLTDIKRNLLIWLTWHLCAKWHLLGWCTKNNRKNDPKFTDFWKIQKNNSIKNEKCNVFWVQQKFTNKFPLNVP